MIMKMIMKMYKEMYPNTAGTYYVTKILSTRINFNDLYRWILLSIHYICYVIKTIKHGRTS